MARKRTYDPTIWMPFYIGDTLADTQHLTTEEFGALIGVTMIVTGFIKRSEPIPFGPYLALAGIVALFWEQPLARLFTGSVVL